MEETARRRLPAAELRLLSQLGMVQRFLHTDFVEKIDVELEVNDVMVPLLPTPEMIHKILTYLSRLSNQG